MLAMVGLSGFENAWPREASGGMQMRVQLARALVTRPRLLLLDEPFAAVDELTRQKLQEDLSALWEQERFTTLLVTHQAAEAVFLSQRVLVMTPRPGRIHADLPIPGDSARRGNLREAPDFHARVAAVSRSLREGAA